MEIVTSICVLFQDPNKPLSFPNFELEPAELIIPRVPIFQFTLYRYKLVIDIKVFFKITINPIFLQELNYETSKRHIT
jgi:hypothetical protein